MKFSIELVCLFSFSCVPVASQPTLDIGLVNTQPSTDDSAVFFDEIEGELPLDVLQSCELCLSSLICTLNHDVTLNSFVAVALSI